MSPDEVRELFAPFGPVGVRRMFGGLGIYADGRMIALVAREELYLKADAESRPVFAAAGSGPFVYASAGRTVELPYMRLPEAAYDDEELLVRYARLADDAARRAPPKPPRRRRAAAAAAAPENPGGEDDHARHEPRGRRGARPRRPTRPPS
jgi:DNA transformation protein